MAGTINLSLSQQFDMYGKPLNGGLLYFIRAGTTATPQNAFQDFALAIPWPNPIVLDAAGRVPAFYLADGQIKIRLTDKTGVQQLVADNLQVIGASLGGGGGGGVDATTVLATGDLKLRYGTGTLTGFVRLNGRTIGSGTSPATERANTDCQPLFEYLWNADPNLVLIPPRGATSIADWLANKQLTLPDGRSRLLAALADMGNAASTLLNGCVFTTGNSTTLGSSYGAGRYQVVTANLPPYTPGGAVSGNFPGGNYALNAGNCHIGQFWGAGNQGTQQSVPAVAGSGFAGGSDYPVSGFVTVNGPITAAFAGFAQGGTSTPFDLNAPTLLITYYIKL